MADDTTEKTGFVGGVFLQRGDGGSPEIYTKVCSVFSISGLGETNDQVESTTFCSGAYKEYIAGLSDGAQITLECNFRADGSDEQITQQSMIADVKAKALRSFEISADGDGDGADNIRFTFQAVCLSWTLNPSPSAKNSISFGVKVSGPVSIWTA